MVDEEKAISRGIEEGADWLFFWLAYRSYLKHTYNTLTYLCFEPWLTVFSKSRDECEDTIQSKMDRTIFEPHPSFRVKLLG